MRINGRQDSRGALGMERHATPSGRPHQQPDDLHARRQHALVPNFHGDRIEAMAVAGEMSLRFLRPAQTGGLIARTTIESARARRLVGTIKLWVDGTPDRLVALAQGTYSRGDT
jgi:hypothetical protein